MSEVPLYQKRPPRTRAPAYLEPLTGKIGVSAADVIRKEAWPFYTTISGVRLCWELEEPKGPKAAGLGWGHLR